MAMFAFNEPCSLKLMSFEDSPVNKTGPGLICTVKRKFELPFVEQLVGAVALTC